MGSFRRLWPGMLAILFVIAAAPAQDWPNWGRDGSRNMVSDQKGLPASFTPPTVNPDGEIDWTTASGAKWVARLGSQSYGNPTVAGGRVFVGTNNQVPRDPKYTGDRGVVLCLDEASGKFIWQLAIPKLAVGNASDYEAVGVCSSPAVDGERVYLVSNRCEVLCVDTSGLANGNDGPFTDEAQYLAGPGQPPVKLGPTDGDIIWRYDMRDELGVFPHNMTSSSVLVVGDRLYVTTSNGRDWTNRHLPSPEAPALICIDKRTGKLLGQEASGISSRTFHCNWSSPALAVVGGREMILFGGDDGFCYGFDPVPVAEAGKPPILREIWRCDCNPAEYRTANGKPINWGNPKGPSGIVATPVFADGRVYVAIGQDPEQGDGAGCLVCLDPGQQGDLTTTGKVWSFTGLRRTMSTVSVAGGLVFIGDFGGTVYCLEAATGKLLWNHDTEGSIWGSTLVADGKVYVGNESGVLTILAASKEKQVLGTIELSGPICSSPIVANGVIYVATDKHLYAIGEKKP